MMRKQYCEQGHFGFLKTEKWNKQLTSRIFMFYILDYNCIMNHTELYVRMTELCD